MEIIRAIRNFVKLCEFTVDTNEPKTKKEIILFDITVFKPTISIWQLIIRLKRRVVGSHRTFILQRRLSEETILIFTSVPLGPPEPILL